MRLFVILGALSGFLAVAAGAFGAHVLKDQLSASLLTIFETGSRYHLVHSLLLVIVGFAMGRHPHWSASVSGWSFLVGILLFSGSLYILAITGIRWLGAITPIGGFALLIGWLALGLWGLWAAR